MAAWRHGDTATWCCNEILSKLLELEWLERVARESGYFGVHLNSNNESRMLQANQMDSMLAKTARDGCNRATRYSYRGLTASAIAAAGAGGSRNLEVCCSECIKQPGPRLLVASRGCPSCSHSYVSFHPSHRLQCSEILPYQGCERRIKP
jgi:hypothetical protein